MVVLLTRRGPVRPWDVVHAVLPQIAGGVLSALVLLGYRKLAHHCRPFSCCPGSYRFLCNCRTYNERIARWTGNAEANDRRLAAYLGAHKIKGQCHNMNLLPLNSGKRSIGSRIGFVGRAPFMPRVNKAAFPFFLIEMMLWKKQHRRENCCVLWAKRKDHVCEEKRADRFPRRELFPTERIWPRPAPHTTVRHKHRKSNRWRTSRIPGQEFMRRFLQHVLQNRLQ